MGPAERIGTLRLRSGRSEDELADALGVTPHSIRDLQEDDAELETVLSIPQALKLAQTLSIDILELLGEAEKPAPLPVARVRAGLMAQFRQAPDSREALEDEIDWDIGPFLEGLNEWESVYTIAFVKRLSDALGLDWRAVLQGIAVA
jgi:transcriptional regulator with XRE-family HTH domain